MIRRARAADTSSDDPLTPEAHHEHHDHPRQQHRPRPDPGPARRVAGADAMGLAFAASRTLHVLAVLGAVALMFQPRANAFFS
ncbi:hypothetical protein ABGB18_37335 [Nonomuraea sp. B12E4]|uniref:hypothetical protein n=1 Tax=Nonomuraea sp. B12E4 TaxID=3153564 RepID=UPI00325E0E71